MREKINLAAMIKEQILVKNFYLNSLKKLPPDIYNLLPNLRQSFLLLREGRLYKPDVKILNDNTILLSADGLPAINNNEVLFLLLPFKENRYIFLGKLIGIEENSYVINFLDPRSDERLSIKKKVPIFLSLIPQQFIRELLQNPEYQLLRESNVTVENYPHLSEIHIYDLILDAKHNVEEKFKKFIQKTLFVGEIVNISKGGIAAKIPGIVQVEDEFNIYYLKFAFSIQKVLKFALFSHLRNIRHLEGNTFFHFAFLRGLNSELWNLIKADLKEISDT